MTEFIAHRVNLTAELERLSGDLGVEVDVRSRNGRLILAHDPHASGPDLDHYLDVYARARRDRLLIVNTKEDGLEEAILAALKGRGIERFFFLDLSFPALVRLALREGERRVALRVSEYEPAGAALGLSRHVEWAWLDCFEGRPPELGSVRELRRSFKVCLVSPELEGFPAEAISGFKTLAGEVDAVCTKHPDLWR